MFLEQACDPSQSKEYWRNVARGSGNGNLLFKGEQLRRMDSGGAFRVNARAGTSTVSVCCPEKEMKAWRWAELRDMGRDEALTELCMIHCVYSAPF